MHIPNLLKARFERALNADDAFKSIDDTANYAGMIRPSGNPAFGDYQSNCAMPIGKMLPDSNPREVGQRLADTVQLDDVCETPDVAGPGFINLKLKDSFLQERLTEMLGDQRYLVGQATVPKKIIVDYSSPNVAKPMHVGHIRSTVIGNCLARTLAFLGHDVVTDNHLGDWGTQFGIIIYGYRHFGDPEVVRSNPVPELAKLYRIVHQLMGYQKAVASLPALKADVDRLKLEHADALAAAEAAEGKDAKKKRKSAGSLEKKHKVAIGALESAHQAIAAVDADPKMKERAEQHDDIGNAVLQETSKLHEGDEENLALWNEFLPFCKDEINRVYDRLNIEFDHTLGESFYHPMLAGVVDDLTKRGLASESDGATCVFLDDFDAPMIVRKRDGAFLYATTDLATLQYRKDTFAPDEILYVVDTRQGEHFEKLFAVAKKIGHDDMKLVHVNFGTVLGEDGRPMKTRSGSLIGLESLLDDAVAAAAAVACDPERITKMDPPMDQEEAKSVSESVGIGAIKYADLGHDRTSDYKFSLKKMVELKGNTATYAQYSYARTGGILRRVEVDEQSVVQRVKKSGIEFTKPEERTLGLKLLQFEEALQSVYADYAPNHLVDYVYATAEAFSRFNNECQVLNAESPEAQTTRLALVVLTRRVIGKSLELLGIEAVKRM